MLWDHRCKLLEVPTPTAHPGHFAGPGDEETGIWEVCDEEHARRSQEGHFSRVHLSMCKSMCEEEQAGQRWWILVAVMRPDILTPYSHPV